MSDRIDRETVDTYMELIEISSRKQRAMTRTLMRSRIKMKRCLWGRRSMTRIQVIATVCIFLWIGAHFFFLDRAPSVFAWLASLILGSLMIGWLWIVIAEQRRRNALARRHHAGPAPTHPTTPTPGASLSVEHAVLASLAAAYGVDQELIRPEDTPRQLTQLSTSPPYLVEIIIDVMLRIHFTPDPESVARISDQMPQPALRNLPNVGQLIDTMSSAFATLEQP